MTHPQDKMRAAFEAYIKANYKPEDGWWCRQIDDGGYSSGNVDSAWKAWQAACAQQSTQSQQCLHAISAYLEAQDNLDNCEYQGINGESHSSLQRRKHAARRDLDAAIATQGASNV